MLSPKGIRAIKQLEPTTIIAGSCRNLNSEIVSLHLIYIFFLKVIQLIYDNLIVVFNKYYSIFSQKTAQYSFPSLDKFEHFLLINREIIPVIECLLEKTRDCDFYYYELYYYAFSLLLLDAFEENTYSELGSRALVMENTIKNTTEIAIELNLIYNRLRQSQITTELIEIIGASEAITSDV